MKSAWSTWGMVSLISGGCTVALGLDNQYGVGLDGKSAAARPGDPCPGAGVRGCAGHGQPGKLVCGPDLRWADSGQCGEGTLCDAALGPEQGTCKPAAPGCTGLSPGAVGCDGTQQVLCGPDLVTSTPLQTCPAACVGGECVECTPGSTRCAAPRVETCDATGAWQNGEACGELEFCIDGACASIPSCAGLVTTCGPDENESCCANEKVPGGTFNRSNDAEYPATISGLRLDRFEITVGRFRRFVEAYPGSKPQPGAGAHPVRPETGWNPEWDGLLPADATALRAALKCGNGATWTNAPGSGERRPINCITWYEAFAFCAWDGGRLPTEAEWGFAAVGGSEQRKYAWGQTSPTPGKAVYDCTADGSQPYSQIGSAACTAGDIPFVGSRSANGDARWGQADMAGSMWEWNMDVVGSYLMPCADCVRTTGSTNRIDSGGSWGSDASSLAAAARSYLHPEARLNDSGARCARSL